MRVVVYDDELEPITVLALPGLTERDIEERGRVWRVTIPEPMSFTLEPVPVMTQLRYVTLSFEPISRRCKDGSIAHAYMCFADNIELALKADPDWLPGQRGKVQSMVRENEFLSRLLMASLGR